ncbi:MAG: hypothetical protein ABIO19_03865 [Burkholderiaceae bacterium]
MYTQLLGILVAMIIDVDNQMVLTPNIIGANLWGAETLLQQAKGGVFTCFSSNPPSSQFRLKSPPTLQ